MKNNRYYTETKKYKNDTTITGFVSADYSIQDDGVIMGSCILYIIRNCPNRYWAKKAGNNLLGHFVTMYGLLGSDKPKKKTESIDFNDYAYGLGYHDTLSYRSSK